jgi:hypothetical protein
MSCRLTSNCHSVPHTVPGPKPHLAKKLYEFERKAVRLVDLGRNWRHMLGDHSSDIVAKRDLFLGKGGIRSMISAARLRA